MFKIALNAGHGLNTAGKRCLASLDPNETREWQLNSRICNKIEEKLKAYEGYKLIRLDDTTGKTDIALKTRTNKANEFGADFYLSIHHNAGDCGAVGNGYQEAERVRALAQRIKDFGGDELAILRQRDTKPEEFAEYNAFVENIKAEERNSTGGKICLRK